MTSFWPYTYEQRVAYWFARIDAQSFMQWLPDGIEGVSNLPGC